MCRSALCCIRPYVVRLCVVRRVVARPNVVRRNVVRPTVGVSVQSVSLSPFHYRIEKYYFISDNIFFANQSESQLLQRATVQYICRTFTGKSIRLYCTVMMPQLLEHVMQSTSVLIAKDWRELMSSACMTNSKLCMSVSIVTKYNSFKCVYTIKNENNRGRYDCQRST